MRVHSPVLCVCAGAVQASSKRVGGVAPTAELLLLLLLWADDSCALTSGAT